MREKRIEQTLVKEVKRLGGIPLKLVNTGMDGIPDRLVLLPAGKAGFIELKAPGKPLRPLQEKRKRQLEALGFLVFKVDGTEQIQQILEEISHGSPNHEPRPDREGRQSRRIEPRHRAGV